MIYYKTDNKKQLAQQANKNKKKIEIIETFTQKVKPFHGGEVVRATDKGFEIQEKFTQLVIAWGLDNWVSLTTFFFHVF